MIRVQSSPNISAATIRIRPLSCSYIPFENLNNRRHLKWVFLLTMDYDKTMKRKAKNMTLLVIIIGEYLIDFQLAHDSSCNYLDLLKFS